MPPQASRTSSSSHQQSPIPIPNHLHDQTLKKPLPTFAPSPSRTSKRNRTQHQLPPSPSQKLALAIFILPQKNIHFAHAAVQSPTPKLSSISTNAFSQTSIGPHTNQTKQPPAILSQNRTTMPRSKHHHLLAPWTSHPLRRSSSPNRLHPPSNTTRPLHETISATVLYKPPSVLQSLKKQSASIKPFSSTSILPLHRLLPSLPLSFPAHLHLPCTISDRCRPFSKHEPRSSSASHL